MGRKRLYANDAERQQACRERVQAAREAMPAILCTKLRLPSRPARLAAVIAELQRLQQEYAAWLDRLPDNFTGGDLSDLLEQTIEELGSAQEILENIELPKGFGRD